MIAIIYEFNGKQYVSTTTYIKLEEENKKLDEAYQIARDRVIELLGDIEQYQKHIKELEEELKKDDREVQVDVDKELLKANDYLIKENKKLKEENQIFRRMFR